MRFKACIAVIFLVAVCIKVFAQSEENEAALMKPAPPDEKDYLYYEEWKMPENYAQDFPLYTEKILYHKFGQLPEMRRGITREDIAKRNITGYQDALKFVYLRELVNFAHKYNVGLEEKIKDWYLRNASQAGYKLTYSSVGSMKDVIDLRFEKIENNIIKEVRLKIQTGKIDVTAYKDQPAVIEEHKKPDVDNEAIMPEGNQNDKENDGNSGKPGKKLESDNN